MTCDAFLGFRAEGPRPSYNFSSTRSTTRQPQGGGVSAVVEDVGVLAGVLERVGQDRQCFKGALVVDAAREGEDSGRARLWVECDRAEGVADDAVENLGMLSPGILD